ncbi:hypothetical protein [Rheinheimera sp.]|uniref:hypothetical protein n=1 Tax=Rheinheimera sp. TaxID=1869214 RepID=UPI004047FB21
MSDEGVWKEFDEDSFEEGVYWFLYEETYLGEELNERGVNVVKTRRVVSLAGVQYATELGCLWFTKVGNFPVIGSDDKIIAYAEVMPPEHPLLK